MKTRRTKLYPEEKMIEGGSSGQLALEEEDGMGLESDRKHQKNDGMNFELGSDKQLKNVSSSQ